MILEDKIPVSIFGQNYEIVGNPSETLHYNSLARHVEDKMKEIMAHTNVVSTQKVAVLAALNIAEELFREKENKSLGGQATDKKVEVLLKKLDGIIKDPSQANGSKAFKPKESPESEDQPEELQLL